MIDELIERVEKGEGADRELEIAIWRQFNDAPPNREPLPWLCCYTESVDAVLGLIREKLPGYMWQLKHGIQCYAIVWQLGEDYDEEGCKTVGYTATSPARALLAAFLKAHKEQHDG